MPHAHVSNQATYYDQRQTKDARDESKRRKMIRWIKSKIGIEDERAANSNGGRGSKPSRERTSLSHSNSSGGTQSFSSMHVGIPYDHQFTAREHRVHVIIIGAGIGGLCLAQGLKKNGIPFTVFERDPTPNYRTQGYRLRINSSGYEALKANLSPENFEVFLRSTGHFQPGFKYLDAQTGLPAAENAAFSHKASKIDNVFSADRAMLRSLLLTDLNDYEIQYGHAFKRYVMLPNGRVEVTFENGRTIEGNVLVGADGTTSRVRRQYIPRSATLLDTDSGAIYGKTPITPEIEAFFATESTTMITSKNPMMSLVMEPRCTTQVNLKEFASVSATGAPDLQNYICWVLIARAQHFHTNDTMTVQDLFSMSPNEVAQLSCEMTRHWAPQVRQIIEHQAPEWCSFLRISTTSPNIKIWQPSAVTLMGDAVHTMAPAGIGCNTALQDARILVKNFKEHGVCVDAIASYERRMREYGREGINVSVEAGKKMYDLPPVEQMRAVVY
ncbi:Cercosporin toxin biosynthesis protein [Globisporangium polare]